jgi:hypothetical protein
MFAREENEENLYKILSEIFYERVGIDEQIGLSQLMIIFLLAAFCQHANEPPKSIDVSKRGAVINI